MSAMPDLEPMLAQFRRQLGAVKLTEQIGRVAQVTGLVIESEGPDVALGDVCRIHSRGNATETLAEVVGFRDHRILLMPLGEMNHVHAGAKSSRPHFRALDASR